MSEKESKNTNLTQAKITKNDEFYTQFLDIANEMNFYKDKLAGKTILCNCDDPFESNFVKYFITHFNELKLKKLLATGYSTSQLCGKTFDCIAPPYGIRIESTKNFLTGTQKDLDEASAKYFVTVMKDKIGFQLRGNEANDKNGKPIYYEAGDFRSAMSLNLLDEADIVITNPPFSLFREYLRSVGIENIEI